MKRSLINFARILFIASIFLSACQPKKTSTGECIPPPVTWEFPVMATKPVEALSNLRKEVVPSGNWKAIDDLPEDYLFVHSIVARGFDEIWIRGDYTIFRFRYSTRSWTLYTKIDNISVIPEYLYVTRDGTLWGIGVTNEIGLQGKKYPLLSRFDEATDQFRFLNDRNNILSSDMQAIDWEGNRDKQGKLWMILAKESNVSYTPDTMLYSFDLVDLQVKGYDIAQNDSILSTLAVASDGKIWVGNGSQLIIFDPDLEISSVFGGTPQAIDDITHEDVIGANVLYFDRGERLWIDDIGWLDFSNPNKPPTWHKIIPSPVFITDSGSSEYQFGSSWPTQMRESVDGFYWFSTYSGMVRLDPETGEWCKFTTGSSPIAEDGQGNLWIAIYEKLYRYQLSR